jgi:hypothetical protein
MVIGFNCQVRESWSASLGFVPPHAKPIRNYGLACARQAEINPPIDVPPPPPVNNPRDGLFPPHGANAVPPREEIRMSPVEAHSNSITDIPASRSGAMTPALQADDLVLAPHDSAAGLDPTVFSKVNASEAFPVPSRPCTASNSSSASRRLFPTPSPLLHHHPAL